MGCVSLYTQQGRCTCNIFREWRSYYCAVVHPAWIPQWAELSDREGKKEFWYQICFWYLCALSCHRSLTLCQNFVLVLTAMVLDLLLTYLLYNSLHSILLTQCVYTVEICELLAQMGKWMEGTSSF